jgi:hypothetical protein
MTEDQINAIIFFAFILFLILALQSGYLTWLVGFALGSLLALFIGLFTSTKKMKKIFEPRLNKLLQSNCDELLREDDILLQSTVYSQTILFVVVSLLSNDVVTLAGIDIKIMIIVIAIGFFTIRSLAKLKDSNKLRRY